MTTRVAVPGGDVARPSEAVTAIPYVPAALYVWVATGLGFAGVEGV
jgi:hypothetical protein